MTRALLPIAAALALGAASGPGIAYGQGHAGHGAPPAPTSAPATPGAGLRISMQALHAAGGVPPGWRFSLPAGDAAAGRKVFVDFKCFACHAVKGEQFPLEPGQTATAGPDLTGMAQHHPTAYLVEAIVNPSAVLVEGPGYIGGDGRSIMPPTPAMTLAQLTDLVAYLRGAGGGPVHAHEAAREQTAGGYRVRLDFVAAAGEHAHHHGGGDAPAAAHGKGRLVATVTDAASGQPVPYAPVSARIEATGRAAQRVTLKPALGAEGLRYVADVTLPERVTRIAVSVGPPAVALDKAAQAQLSRAQTLVFDWK